MTGQAPEPGWLTWPAAGNPARVPPRGSGPNPLTSNFSEPGPGHATDGSPGWIMWFTRLDHAESPRLLASVPAGWLILTARSAAFSCRSTSSSASVT